MKLFILILTFGVNGFAGEKATLRIDDKYAPGAAQQVVLEKVKKDIWCKVSDQPSRKIKIKSLKSLKFPIQSRASVDCDKTVAWTYKKKTEKSCLFERDQVIHEILFQCYN